jgi:hypothetical protein
VAPDLPVDGRRIAGAGGRAPSDGTATDGSAADGAAADGMAADGIDPGSAVPPVRASLEVISGEITLPGRS